MSNRPNQRIPESFSHPFGEAAILLFDWKGGTDEPLVNLEGTPVPIGFLFDLVVERKFSDQVPARLLQLLLTYASSRIRRVSGRRVVTAGEQRRAMFSSSN
jgi:hypothetical protein